MIDRMKENHFIFDDDHRNFQQKIENLQRSISKFFFFFSSKNCLKLFYRQLMALEDDNATLLRNLNAKDEALRNTQVTVELFRLSICSTLQIELEVH